MFEGALDESVEAQTPQVIGGLAGSVVAVVAQQLCDAVAHVTMAKAGRVESEQTQRLHQGQDPAVAEAEAGGAPEAVFMIRLSGSVKLSWALGLGSHRSAVYSKHAVPWTRRGKLLRRLPGRNAIMRFRSKAGPKRNVLDSGRGRPVRRILVYAMRGLAQPDRPTSLDRGSSATK